MMGTYSSLPRLLTPQDSRYTIVDINKTKVLSELPRHACAVYMLCKNSTNNVDVPVAVANTKTKLPMCTHDWFAILP